MAARPFILVPGAARATIFAHAPALMSPAEMTFGLARADGADWTTGDCVLASGIISNWVTTNYTPLVANEVVFDHVEVHSLAADPFPFDDRPIGFTATGGTGTFSVIATMTTLNTGISGRSNQGRSYGIFPPDGSVVNGFFTPTFQGLVATAYAALGSAIALGGTLALAVVSEKNHVYTLVTSFTTHPTLAYQTRRDPNRG